jgi:LCP family protein required for cell wall assembly
MRDNEVNISKKQNKTANGKPKAKSERAKFITTFVVALILVMAIATPLFAMVDEVLEMRPGDEDNPVLAETIDFQYLIPADSPFFDAFVHTNRVNILALGIDRNNLADMIMLASFEIDHGFLDIISIPRDTFFLGSSTQKINAAYRRDPVNVAVAVSDILMNIPINYYVTLSHQGVANIIDEIGGVSINVPFHMRYDDPRDTPPLRIDIPAGYQLLDGEQSINFLRFRYANPGFRAHQDGDLGRIRLQQEFVRNAIMQSIGLNLPSIIQTAFREVQSDITVREALELGNLIIGIDSENIRTHQLPLTQRGGHHHPNVEAIKEMLIEIYSMEPFADDENDDLNEDDLEE